MTYKKLKLLSNIVICLLSISCIFTVLGIKRHSELQQNNVTEYDDANETIQFRYFLEDVEIEEIPQNEKILNKKTNEEEVNILYKYDGIKCSEGVRASFNTVDWKVEIQEDGKGTCDLTFYKSKYDMSFIVINGVEDENNPKTIERSKDGEFIIKPNEGYEYLDSQCSNNKVATYDKTNSIFKLNSINSDMSCKITFTQKKFVIELTVKNGVLIEGTNGVSKMEAYYGESATQIVTPMDGFEYTQGHLVCEGFNPNETKKKNKKKKTSTPVQQVEYKNNTFTVTEVTTDTKCTLTFTKTKEVKYKIKILNSEDYSDKFAISKGSDIIEVVKGKTGEIKIKSLDGSTPKLVGCNEYPKDNNPAPLNSEYTFTWLNVTKDISCKLDEKK